MGPVSQLEKPLADIYKAAPALPDSAKKSIVELAPWAALVLGILQLLATLSLWNLGHSVSTFWGVTYTNALGIGYWLSLAMLGISGVLMLMAYPGLKAKKKAGWDWLFLSALVYLAYGVVALFDSYYGSMSDLIGAVIGAIITWYFLFQIRSSYSAK